MKKTMIAAGAASLALAAMPVLGVFANQTDTIVVEIAGSCEVELNVVADDPSTAGVDESETGHTNGDATWSGNTLTGTMSNGTATNNYGSSKLRVTCNDNDGFVVTATMNALEASTVEDGSGNKLTIPANASFSGSSSGYALKVTNPTTGLTATNGSSWVGATGTIVSASTPISAGTFDVTYGVGVSTTQAADTYTGTVVYGIVANS